MMTGRTLWAVWGAIYVALTAAILWGLITARARQVDAAARPEAREEWEEWRESVRHGNEAEAPVARRVPTTEEMPATILLRDHFAGVCASLLLVWTAFFGFLAMVTTGILRGTPPPARD